MAAGAVAFVADTGFFFSALTALVAGLTLAVSGADFGFAAFTGFAAVALAFSAGFAVAAFAGFFASFNATTGLSVACVLTVFLAGDFLTVAAAFVATSATPDFTATTGAVSFLTVVFVVFVAGVLFTAVSLTSFAAAGFAVAVAVFLTALFGAAVLAFASLERVILPPRIPVVSAYATGMFPVYRSSSLRPLCQQLKQDYADINIRHKVSIDVNVNFLSGCVFA
ncbi:hypothetical protein QUF18_02490 [Pseudochrobactrum kiredjianiae]|uniref:Pentapeptide repeat-containing protein n=1 Tax=Pseudochrobactrum kiredjianiae TaxID=386305 RepID=A0ABW3V5G6_9HYPH|nr:hypothetical protein [Pseudochrobactrum kiredjianiae]MDM7849899.1 hypothetical protein [Pseudochrobactrum kiredjianiae]